MELQLIPSYKIDENKWQECLKCSTNNLIYASYNYLNTLAGNWHAIIIDDYDFIMPVAWRKKFGIKYCYNIPFVQQLGLFGKKIEEPVLNDCYNFFLQNFKYGDYAFNYKNTFSNAGKCSNYILSLASNYISTAEFYSDKLKADLRKISAGLLQYVNASADEAIHQYKTLYGHRFTHVTNNDYDNLALLCTTKKNENNLVVRKVIANGNLVAINLLIKDKLRLYNLISCTTMEGRSKLAGHFLYDNLIKEFSQTGLLLDFEGSDIDGVAHFYKSFGAINQPYTKMHFNNLPKVLQLLKH